MTTVAVTARSPFVYASALAIDVATMKLVPEADTVARETEIVFERIAARLRASGLSLADVVKTTCFLADIADFATFNAIYARFFPDPPPARSTFQVAALPKGARVEVEAIAVRDRG